MPRPKKGEPNKSEFIRNHPDLSPADLVAKAKDAGLVITTTLVHTVRGRAVAKGAAPAKRVAVKAEKKAAPTKAAAAPAPAPAAKKGPTKAGPKVTADGVSASDFIRSLPIDMPRTEVIAKAAEKGLHFSPGLVYMVRSKMTGGSAKPAKAAAPAKAAPKAAAKKPGPKPGPKPAAAALPVAATGDESTFRKLVVALGVERAKALVTDVEHKLAALFGG